MSFRAQVLLEAAHREGLCARQLADKIKRGFDQGGVPDFPEDVAGQVPVEARRRARLDHGLGLRSTGAQRGCYSVDPENKTDIGDLDRQIARCARNYNT